MINNLGSKKKKSIFVFGLYLFLTSYNLLLPSAARAVCPICTVAVGAGLGLSRYLGIDDAVSSIWIGGLILSSSFWLIDWIKKKKSKFSISSPSRSALRAGGNFQFPIILGMYAVVLIPLWYSDIIGHPLNTILGVDKIIFGTALGSIMFLIGFWTDRKVRVIKGKQLFSYQKVVFPLISLVLASLLVYYYGGYLY